MPPLDLAECQLSVVEEREKAPPRDYGIKEALRRVMHPAHLQILVILSVVMFSLSFMEAGVFQWIIQYFKETNPDAESPASIAAPLARVLTVLLLLALGPDKFPRITFIRMGLGLSPVFLFLTTASSVTWIQTTFVFLRNTSTEIVWAVSSLYSSEAFPTDVRATAAAIVYVFASIGSLSSSVSTGGIMRDWGPEGGLYVLGSVCMLGFFCQYVSPCQGYEGEISTGRLLCEGLRKEQGPHISRRREKKR